jgi:hypothetical protein
VPEADGEFKLAGAYVEVHLKDETTGDEKKIRAKLEGDKPIKLETALKDPDNTRIVKEKIEREAKPTIRPEVTNPIDEAWRRKIQAAIASTATKALDVPVTPDTDMFRRDLEASLKKAQTLVRAEIPTTPEGAEKYRAQLQALVHVAETGIKAHIPVEVDEKQVRDAARRGGDTANAELGRAAKRANAQFDGLKFLGLSAGLPAAAVVGAAGATAALALVSGGFGLMAVSLVSGNERVQSSFQQLSHQVQTDAAAMAQPLENDVVGAIGTMNDAWTKVRPAVQTAVRGSAPAIRELSGAASDFAVNVMPGVVVAVESAEAPLRGLRSFTAQTGTGLSNFFTNLAKGGEDAGQSMRDFGGITQNLLGQSGALLANLASGGHTVLPQFGGAVDQVLTVANNLATHGMPLLTGTTSGFLGTVGGGLNIVTGMTAALGSWAEPVGQLGGSMLATNSIAKLFGTSLTDTGFGVKAFSATMDEAGNRTTPFKAAMDGVEGKGAKLKAGMKSVVDNGINPLGLALLAGGFLLDQWGKKSQEAAAKAAEFNASVADIKGTLSSTGAVTANTRAMEANNLATKKLGTSQHTGSQLLAEYGVSGQIATDAMTGSAGALDRLNKQMDMNVRGTLSANLTQGDWQTLQDNGISKTDAYTAALGGSVAGYKNLDEAIQGTSGSTDENINRLNSALGAIHASTQGQRDLVTEVRDQARATAEAQRQMRELGDATGFAGDKLKMSAADSAVMSGALATLGDATKTVADQGGALGVVLDQLSGKGNTLSAAQAQTTKAFDDTDKYMKQVNDSGGKLKGTFSDLVNGEGGINGLTASGASLEGVFGSLSTAMGTEVAAAFAQSQATGDSLATSLGRVEEVTQRTRDKFIAAATAAGLTKTQAGQLADKLGLIPAEVAVQFAAKGDQQLQDKLLGIQGQLKAVPDKKGIVVDALAQPAIDALQTLGEQVVQLPDGRFQVFADTKEGRDAASQLLNEINHYYPVVAVHANTSDATGSVTQWQQQTNNTWGMTTTDTRIDPATGKVQSWQMQANGTWGWTNLNSRNDPANGKLQLWVQQANGTWAWVNADAKTGAANAAIDYAARDRTATINVGVNYRESVRVPGTNIRMFAEGGIAAFAKGGVAFNDAGRTLSPMAPLANIVPPGTLRVIGDNMRVPEAYIPIDPMSSRSQRLLDETNARMGRIPAMAGGTTVNNYITVHSAAMDPNSIAAAVSSELGWSMRGA